MKEKVVVITGASRGIGRAISLEFAKKNYFLAICSKNKKNLDKIGGELRLKTENFIKSAIDLRKEREVKGFIKSIINKKKRIDILINNAGLAHVSTIQDTSLELWRDIIETNLTSTFLMVKYCLPYMSENSHIINIGSNASKIGFPNWAAYCASKFGVLGFTNSLRVEVRDKGIKVSAVLPGPTKTDIWDDLKGEWDEDKMMDPKIVAKTVYNVANQPKGANIDEIDIVPSVGRL